jgi:hypothetical protein
MDLGAASVLAAGRDACMHAWHACTDGCKHVPWGMQQRQPHVSLGLMCGRCYSQPNLLLPHEAAAAAGS